MFKGVEQDGERVEPDGANGRAVGGANTSMIGCGGLLARDWA